MYENRDVSIQEVAPSEWNLITSIFSDCSYEQTYDYAVEAARRIGGRVRFLKVEQGDRLIGATCVRLKTLPLVDRGIAYISAGPMTSLGSDENREAGHLRSVLSCLRSWLVDESGHILRVRPPLLPTIPRQRLDGVFGDLGFQRANRARHYRTCVIDLRQDPEELLRRLNGKWRTDLNYARKAGLSVETGSDIKMFLRFEAMFERMHEKKGFPVMLGPSFFQRLEPKSLGLEILIAHRDGRDAAGHVSSRLGDSAVYLLGAADDLGRETKAAYLLNWVALLRAKEAGISWYDLGGVDEQQNPGVYRFKSRMGGVEMSSVGPYEIRPSGVIGEMIIGLEGVYSAIRRNR